MSDIDPLLLERMKTIFEFQVPLTIGRATIAWNTLSRSVFDIFHLLSGWDEASAKAAFFVVSSDRSQRDMVTALCATKISPVDADLAKKLRSALGSIDKLAGKRNDVLHVVLEQEHSSNLVRQFHERGHLKGKIGAELIEAIHQLAMSCLDLASELTQLRGQIYQLPQFQNQLLAEALLEYTARRKSAEWPNQPEYGLLGSLATNSRSPEETPG